MSRELFSLVNEKESRNDRCFSEECMTEEKGRNIKVSELECGVIPEEWR